MSHLCERSFDEIQAAAQRRRARYCRWLLLRAYRAGKAWLRHRVSPGAALKQGGVAVIDLHVDAERVERTVGHRPTG